MSKNILFRKADGVTSRLPHFTFPNFPRGPLMDQSEREINSLVEWERRFEWDRTHEHKFTARRANHYTMRAAMIYGTVPIFWRMVIMVNASKMMVEIY